MATDLEGYILLPGIMSRDAYEIAFGAILSHVSNGKEPPDTFNTFSAAHRTYSAG